MWTRNRCPLQLILLTCGLASFAGTRLFVLAASIQHFYLQPGGSHRPYGESKSQEKNPPRVINFALVDVTTNQTIIPSMQTEHEDNFVLDVASLREQLSQMDDDDTSSPKVSIRVEAEGSVHFMVLDFDFGLTVRTAMSPPYALGHSNVLAINGHHTLKAIPYDRQGRVGESRTLKVQVVRGLSKEEAKIRGIIHRKDDGEERASRTFVRPPNPDEDASRSFG